MKKEKKYTFSVLDNLPKAIDPNCPFRKAYDERCLEFYRMKNRAEEYDRKIRNDIVFRAVLFGSTAFIVSFFLLSMVFQWFNA